MRIVITGTPGTGKTRIARALSARAGVPLVDIKDFVNRRRLFTMQGGQKTVDIPRLEKSLLPFLKKLRGYVVEGHLACEMALPASHIFVLRTSPDILKRRLSGRKYGKAKLDDNLLSEMLDYCVQRAELVYKRKPLELDTTGKGAEECADAMLKAIRQRKKKMDVVDYSAQLMHYLRLRR
jgi:adenylate kinase